MREVFSKWCTGSSSKPSVWGRGPGRESLDLQKKKKENNKKVRGGKSRRKDYPLHKKKTLDKKKEKKDFSYLDNYKKTDPLKGVN